MRLSVERKIDCQINGKMSESGGGNKSQKPNSLDPIPIIVTKRDRESFWFKLLRIKNYKDKRYTQIDFYKK